MTTTIAVIGLGYIGLPTASMFAAHGHRVRGVDVNPEVIGILKQGAIHIEEPGLSTIVKAAIASGHLTVDTKVEPADVFIIAVPTPYQPNASGIPTADMSYVRSAVDAILPHLKKGDLVVLESTSPPGTTQSILVSAIEKRGFKVGPDIGVAYCPERVIPGSALKELIGNDRVVGAVTPEWAEKTKKLYQSFVSGRVWLTTPTVAEMVKIIENTYRDVNIAFANEVSVLCENLGIDAWEVISLANRHPRVEIHRPGPGVGGHCISVDPWFLVEMYPEDSKLIKTARTVNDGRPARVVDKILSLLKKGGPSKVAVLGLSYKGNVDDVRESPSFSVIHLLRTHHPEITLAISDSHVKQAGFSLVPVETALEGADLAVILTAHDEYKTLNPADVAKLMKGRVVLDAHHILSESAWRQAGFDLAVLGRGSPPEPSGAKR